MRADPLSKSFPGTMMQRYTPEYPSMYEVNTRVWLTDLSEHLGRKATLDDISDASLDEFRELGFDWIWFLSVWTTGEIGRRISRESKVWRLEFEETLPDLQEEDIGGSGFAIAGYQVSPELGGDAALKRLRERLNQRGIKLMLDFVPNHMGPDHPWVNDRPEYFIRGTSQDIENHPLNYTRLNSQNSEAIFAYGRDPYFDGWPDTVQLDYSNAETVKAMKQELSRIAGQCDGLRCDMAMVILPEVFEKTWGRRAFSFWPEAIKVVRDEHPDFCFMAEVYWDMERTLQQLGFGFTYDKRLYDRLLEGNAALVREHFRANIDYQQKLVRFLENHDERRAASVFDLKKNEATALISFLSPGMRFFHQGQLEGRKKRTSPHLIRAPHETPDSDLQHFYSLLLNVLTRPVFRNGKWRLLECIPAWDDNGSWDAFIAFAWQGGDRELFLVVVNYSPNDGQCYLRLPFLYLTMGQWRLHDIMNEVTYIRNGSDLLAKGLYLGMKPWQYHVFEVKK